MSVRNPNIGIMVCFAMMAVGVLIVGGNASDTELQLICWPAIIIGFVVFMALDIRDERREKKRR